MMIKAILVPFTDAKSGATALETALVVAGQFAGHVKALHVLHSISGGRSSDGSLTSVGVTNFRPEEAVAVLSDSLAEAQREKEKVAKDARDRFDMIIAAKGIAPVTARPD